MATKLVQHWCTTIIYSLWILATVFGSTAGSFTKDLDKTTEPNVLTATSNSLTIQVPCVLQGTCVGKQLTLKESGNSELSRTIDLVPRTRINYLKRRTEYIVNTTVDMNGTTIIKGRLFRTCPDVVPEISSIRIAKAGPGMLDLRWPPVRDLTCQSNIFYIVQYGTDSTTNDLIFSPEKKYGIMRRANGDLIFRPTHPCAAWDKEFCLLLTDYVKPGLTHTVAVKPVRFDFDSPSDGPQPARNESSKGYIALAYADPTEMGPYTLGQPDANGSFNSLKNSPFPGQKPTTVGVWIIVLAVLLILCALAVHLAVCVRRRHRSKSDQLAFYQYDDVGSPVNPRSISNLIRAATTHQDLVPAVLHNVLKSIHPKKTGIGATIKAGHADKETITKPSASSHCLSTKLQPLSEDAEYLVMNLIETPYSNIPGDSNVYIEPSSPISDKGKFGLARKSKASEGYAEIYSHKPENPWRSQI